MSEPLSAGEIEDVLSSIRRLVSEDLRPTHKLVSAALQNGAAKLILTPALRVVASDSRGYGSYDTLDDPGDLETTLARVESSEQADPVEIVPMFGSVRLQEMADVRLENGTRDDVIAADANFLASAMSRINGLSAPDAYPQTAQPETIEAVVAAVGAAVGPDEWELDGGEPAPHAQAFADTVWNSAEVQATQTVEHSPLFLRDTADSVAQNDDHAGSGDALDQDQASAVAIDVPETVSVAPDVADDGDALRQDSIVFQDDMAAQDAWISAGRTSAERADDGGTAARGQPDYLEDSAGFLNEDLLRDIVRDMIQMELQGTLGERITRNVRKLVRSEINRALAARDYE